MAGSRAWRDLTKDITTTSHGSCSCRATRWLMGSKSSSSSTASKSISSTRRYRRIPITSVRPVTPYRRRTPCHDIQAASLGPSDRWPPRTQLTDAWTAKRLTWARGYPRQPPSPGHRLAMPERYKRAGWLAGSAAGQDQGRGRGGGQRHGHDGRDRRRAQADRDTRADAARLALHVDQPRRNQQAGPGAGRDADQGEDHRVGHRGG